MSKNRLEAFSDGVMAIIITIMVLELAAPHSEGEPGLADLAPLLPVFLSYALSFVYVGIYWNNHHHLLQSAERVDGRVLWANLCLLFWLSLVPFASGWMGENGFAAWPVALYGVVLWLCGLGYFVLERALVGANGGEASLLAQAVGVDRKGLASMGLYLAAVAVAWVWPWVAVGVYVVVALMWVVPDQRIERRMKG